MVSEHCCASFGAWGSTVVSSNALVQDLTRWHATLVLGPWDSKAETGSTRTRV